jgi:4-amino-4-deoxychorismate lyase
MPPSPGTALLAALDSSGTPYRPDPTAPLIRADDLAVLRGEAVFETLRAFAGRPFQLDAHLARMAHSAARVRLELPPPDRLHALVGLALDGFGPADASLRLVATKGPEGAARGAPVGTTFALVAPVAAATEEARRNGMAVVTLTLGVPAELRREAPWLLDGVKSTSYAVAMAAQREAAERGAADAIYLSWDGEVLEGTTSSVVAVLDGQAVTPPEDEVGILAGTSVGFFDGQVQRRRLRIDELRRADEVMLLSSVRGVAPVLRIDDQPVADGTIGPRTAEFRSAYEAAVHALAEPEPELLRTKS